MTAELYSFAFNLVDGDAIRANVNLISGFQPSRNDWIIEVDYNTNQSFKWMTHFRIGNTNCWPFHLTSWLICELQLFSHE